MIRPNTVNLGANFPEVVTLCGSTRFPQDFADAAREETLAGRVVLSVGLFGHGEGLDMAGPVKQALDALHKHKIYLADSVLVVTKHVGESTRSEIDYARSLGKEVRFRHGEG